MQKIQITKISTKPKRQNTQMQKRKNTKTQKKIQETKKRKKMQKKKQNHKLCLRPLTPWTALHPPPPFPPVPQSVKGWALPFRYCVMCALMLGNKRPRVSCTDLFQSVFSFYIQRF